MQSTVQTQLDVASIEIGKAGDRLVTSDVKERHIKVAIAALKTALEALK